MNEFANQYGINLGAIDQSVSQKKTAEQNLKFNDMKMNAFAEESKAKEAEKESWKGYKEANKDNPSIAIADSFKTAVGYNELDKEKRLQVSAAAMKANDSLGIQLNTILHLPPEQHEEAVIKMVSGMPPLQQQVFTKQYGSTPAEMVKNIPEAFTNTYYTHIGIDGLYKETMQEKEYGYKKDIEGVKQNALAEREQSKDARIVSEGALNRANRVETSSIRGAGTGRQTDLDKKAAAIVDDEARKGNHITIEQATKYLLEPKTYIDKKDPVFGDTKTTVNKKYGSQLNNIEVKPMPQLVNSRDEAFKALKATYKGKSDEEINSYLDTKGI